MFVKMTLPQVVAQVRKTGRWHGYVVGNNVNEYHIVGGWHLGFEVTFVRDANGKGVSVEGATTCEYNPDTDRYETVPQGMADWLANWAYYNANSETGKRAAFYRVVKG